MNDRSIIQTPDPEGRGTWLDPYLPENQIVQYQPRAQLINVAAVRGVLFRQRWLVAAIVAASLIAGLVFTLMATPMYQATATVRVDPYGSFIVEGQDIDQGIASNQVYDLMSTQTAVIRSRNLASAVAAELNLGERYDLLGEDIDTARPPNMSDEDWLRSKERSAASILQGSVTAELTPDQWIITIGYRSDDPVLAAEMANAYADAFVASDTRSDIAANEYAQEYLQEQIQLIRSRLQEAEEASNAYARSSGIIVQQGVGSEEGGTVTLTGANLTNINQRVSDARAKRIDAEQRWRAIQNLPAAQLPEVQSNAVLQGLVNQRTGLQTELIELRQRYNDEFPQIVNVKAQIATLDRQIQQSSADIKATVRNEYTVARNQEQALERELNSLTGETMVEQDRQVQYSVLEREAQALRDQLKALLDRYNTISTAANVQSGTLSKLDSATVPASPYSPNLLRNLMVSLVFGVALAGGLAVLRESFDDRIRSLDEVEDKIGLPLLGHTPFVESRDLEKEETNRFSALMEAYASIRSAIDFTLPRNQNVIQLTSSQASEGKSTTAVILAELFASLGRKTLLIDADLRRPSVARLLDIEDPQAGLVEVVLGHTDLQSTVVKGLHENLEILPIGSISPNPTELLASQQMREFIEKSRHEYSLIIFDSCPVMGLADAPLLSRLVDGTIFVLEANKVHFGQAKAAIKRVRGAGGNILGVILTKYRALEAGQSYDYQYGYYQYGQDD
ncbi:polysaccharide biosynthesis tyrosine autokinase [Erythrobacter sp. JK5]|uniref:GumC family protein n=1 Tax=Erythrobacter sp. JK5 TaxID=2829500 RepID=UPI001BA840F9|nr:polysaccharide biosynthesis tyrosine autokinase [Erythrobacter sp. JK5]QUL37674.1 polysaccharide biosynthesis tyrosine autokinase [Erythrobacter sp. JK5]